MKNIIFKAICKKGLKGAKGALADAFVAPTGAIIGYDDIDTPAGYIDTTKPSKGNTITITITDEGVYNAADYNVDGFSTVIVTSP